MELFTYAPTFESNSLSISLLDELRAVCKPVSPMLLYSISADLIVGEVVPLNSIGMLPSASMILSDLRNICVVGN